MKEHDNTSPESGMLGQAWPQTICLSCAGYLPCVSADPFPTLSTLPSVLGGCSLWSKSRATRPSGFPLGSVDGSHWQEVRREEGGMGCSFPQLSPFYSLRLAASHHDTGLSPPLGTTPSFVLSARGAVMAPCGCKPWEYWAILILPEPCPHLLESVIKHFSVT